MAAVLLAIALWAQGDGKIWEVKRKSRWMRRVACREWENTVEGGRGGLRWSMEVGIVGLAYVMNAR